MDHVRFAPSPTGSLHVGSALSAVANRMHGGSMLLRIDDTDAARNVAGGVEEILRDLEWLGIRWDEGPVRQSERADRHREAARAVGTDDRDGTVRFGHTTLLRPDGSPTYQLASVVDDVDFAITHVIRGTDHRANEPLHIELARALGAEPPQFVHHGLVLGEDGRKLSKRDHPLATLEQLRDAGIPPEAVRAYLEELGLPRHDIRFDEPRVRRLAIEAIAAFDDAKLARRADAPVDLVPALRGARDLVEARDWAQMILHPEPAELPDTAPLTLTRFRELLERTSGTVDPKSLVRELKAVGGDLKALRLALTGRERGPELSSVLAALSRDETLRRVDAAL